MDIYETVEDVLDRMEDALDQDGSLDVSGVFFDAVDWAYPTTHSDIEEWASSYPEIWNIDISGNEHSTAIEALQQAVFNFIDGEVLSHPDYRNLEEFGVRNPED